MRPQPVNLVNYLRSLSRGGSSDCCYRYWFCFGGAIQATVKPLPGLIQQLIQSIRLHPFFFPSLFPPQLFIQGERGGERERERKKEIKALARCSSREKRLEYIRLRYIALYAFLFVCLFGFTQQETKSKRTTPFN